MHVAFIIDQERLEREQAMLNRLSIGLMVEGVQLTRIVPEAMTGDVIDEGEQRVALVARIEAPMSVLPWMRQARVNTIAEEMSRPLPDILYAVGEMAWTLGIDLGQRLERPVLLDVCSMAQAQSAPRLRVR